MSAAEIKEKLLDIIEHADDDQLETFYELIQVKEDRQYKYTAQEIIMFEEMEAEYLRGEGKSYTVDEAMEMIKKNKI